MKAKLNLTIDDTLLLRIKKYAANHHVSISELVETYFHNLTKASKKMNIVELMDKKKKPSLTLPKDLKKAYYEEQREKYGF